MQTYQQQFINFSMQRGALCFGEFKLKSGRLSPYFFNSGYFNSGDALARLGQFYAQAIMHSGVPFDILYGPAYKGIPLVAATAVALAQNHQRDVPYCFNRKETKDHGEGGLIVGAPLRGKVLIVDDVISAGTSVRESVEIIRAHSASVAGVVIALDRQERGQGARSAIQEVETDFGLKVISILALEQILEFLSRDAVHAKHLQQVRDYQSQYGVSLA